MDFYITLSSNVDGMKIFGESNKIGEFKTKLGRGVELDGKWGCAVVSFSYRKTWFNIQKPHKITLFDELGKIYGQNQNVVSDDFTISPGFYDTPQKLINTINGILSKFTTIKAPKILYNELENTVTVEAGKIEKTVKIYPFLGDEVENILGLRNRTLKNLMYTHNQQDSGLVEYVFSGADVYREEKLKAFHPVEISGGYHSLYLYSDVVYPSLVGDTFAQLLRVIEVPRKAKFGDTVHLNYEKPFYMPVMLNNFETIEICVKDDTDNVIPFMFGRTTVVLHFKKL